MQNQYKWAPKYLKKIKKIKRIKKTIPPSDRLQWIPMDSIDFKGFQWIFMDFNRFPLISMISNGFLWISMDFDIFQ